MGQVLVFDDHRDELGVVDHVAQFRGYVPPVDVDGDRAALPAAEQRLDVLRPIARVDADMVARDDVTGAELARDPVRGTVERPARVANVPATRHSASGPASQSVSHRSARLNVVITRILA